MASGDQWQVKYRSNKRWSRDGLQGGSDKCLEAKNGATRGRHAVRVREDKRLASEPVGVTGNFAVDWTDQERDSIPSDSTDWQTRPLPRSLFATFRRALQPT